MSQPYLVRLMRLYKPTGAVDVCVEQVSDPSPHGMFHYHYTSLWHWIGGDDGFVHPHPDCCYWIDDRARPAYPQVAVTLRDYVC